MLWIYGATVIRSRRRVSAPSCCGRNSDLEQDAKRYLSRWGDHARACGWTAAQQDRLIRQIKGREVKQLTDTQALVNRVFYRSQLGM
jgi:hypothetical protein